MAGILSRPQCVKSKYISIPENQFEYALRIMTTICRSLNVKINLRSAFWSRDIPCAILAEAISSINFIWK